MLFDYIGGTHIKASASKKKYQKEQAAKTAKVYARQLQEEVNAGGKSLGNRPEGTTTVVQAEEGQRKSLAQTAFNACEYSF